MRPDLLSLYVSLERVPEKINLICANEILILGTSCRGTRLTASGGKHCSLLNRFVSTAQFLIHIYPTCSASALQREKQPLDATYYMAKSTGTKIDKFMQEQSEAGLRQGSQIHGWSSKVRGANAQIFQPVQD